jgi:hypothetical protein
MSISEQPAQVPKRRPPAFPCALFLQNFEALDEHYEEPKELIHPKWLSIPSEDCDNMLGR